MSEKELVEETKKQVKERIEAELPYVFDKQGIQSLVSVVQNGEIHLTLRVYNGFVTDLVNTQVVQRLTFKHP